MNMQSTTIKSVCNIQGGYAFKSNVFVNKGIPVVRIGDIKENKVVFDTKTVYVKEEDLESYSNYVIHKNDILVALSGATTGKFGVYLHDKPALLNQRVAKISPKDSDQINKHYLRYCIKNLSKQINQDALGVAQPNISPTAIGNMEIPLMEIKVQEEIVSILKSVESTLSKRQQQIEALSALKQSIFLDMFGDPRVNDKEWSTVTIKQLSEEITQINPKKLDEKINYLDISSINNRNNEINQVHQYHSSEAPSRARQKVKQGDILISTVRPNLKNIARIELAGEYIASSGFCVIRTKKVDQLFLYELIKLDYFTEELTKLTTGANYPAIKKSDVLNQKIILPSIELQNKFSERIKVINKQINLLSKSLEQINLLYDSILHKAFNGELFKENIKV